MYPCKKEAYRDYTNKRRKHYKDTIKRKRERSDSAASQGMTAATPEGQEWIPPTGPQRDSIAPLTREFQPSETKIELVASESTFLMF